MNKLVHKKLTRKRSPTALSQKQIDLVNTWYYSVNEWRIPKEFRDVRNSKYNDGKDHIRVMYDVFSLLEKAFK